MTVRWPALWRGLQAVILETGTTRAVVLPEAGAKIVSLSLNGREALWHNPHVPVHTAPYGARYRDYGASGIDVCFPSITASALPGRSGPGRSIPDHGEVWAMPWTVDTVGGQVRLTVTGRVWPYRLSMMLRLAGGALDIETVVENMADEPLSFLWALHPAFPLSPGTRLACEASGTPDVSWPSHLGAPGLTPDGFVSKEFVGPLSEGIAILTRDQDSVKIRWDVEALPYLGVWVSNEDETRSSGRRCIAVEPTVAPFDGLDAAEAAGQAPILPPHASRSWDVTIAPTG